ncbi:MAG: hypothetical protein ACREI8_05245 [Myxococcota bacterium]
MGPRLQVALAVALFALVGCGRSNPVLGDWEVDRSATDVGAVYAVQATQLERLTFTRDGITAGDTTIEGSYVVEEGRVRLVRGDGRGEHAIEVLSEDQIRVALPIGVTAFYRRKP